LKEPANKSTKKKEDSMRRNDVRILVVLSGLLFIASCASTPPPAQKAAEVRPMVSPDMVTLHVVADPQLNLYNGLAHALHLCVSQLTDPNSFNQLSNDEKGLSKLMNCERGDQSVAFAQRIVVQPGEDRVFELQKAEGAKYVGIVAGYYQMQKRSAVRLYRLPETVGPGQAAAQRPLRIELDLGPRELRERGVKP
jgi:type VI secretion system VasD/TssJ family lipoprotein